MMRNITFVFVAMVAVGSGAFLFWLMSQKSMPEHALYYQQARVIKAFTLVDQHNNIFENKRLLNKWSWVFLGYTSCPDVCPTTLQELNYIYQELKDISKNTQIIFVSADPKRDTSTQLDAYIKYFNAEFIAVSAGHEHLFPFVRNLGLMYALNDATGENNYTVDHSGSMVLINPDGNIAAIFQPQHEPGQLPIIDGAKLVNDFSKIVALF